ncbi:MAG: hypothetical protein GY694_01370 [Gammaproteobacteria bacterium]|nr:hypothetical protein [Gammaproteobacteria bacterium]
MQRKVAADTKIPKNWNDFLHVSENKQQLFEFLSSKVKDHKFPDDLIVVIADGQLFGAVGEQSSEFAFPNSNHKEADTRILIHLRHAMALGAKTLQLCTVDISLVA